MGVIDELKETLGMGARSNKYQVIINGTGKRFNIGVKGDSSGPYISAGFFAVGAEPRDGDPDDISVSAFGKSVTLKLESRKKEDARLIKRVLRKNYN